ncbi:MAG: SH3 domain-containing protein [Solobacterium sp.]|nr:SH3 domain-containing protein [Solobacterium sp.]
MQSYFRKLIAGAAALITAFAVFPVRAEQIEYSWDEETRVSMLRRKVATAVNVYTDGKADDITHEEGMLDGVLYDILRVTPSGHTFLQVDYSETPQYLDELIDPNTVARGYKYAGGINAGYFSTADYNYGQPVGAVRRNNEWTTWQGSPNTPAYGNGFATAYIDGNDLTLRYHGWSWGFWHGDSSWQWWSGYNIDADYAVSGSFTYYADGTRQDLTNGAFGSVDYRKYGRAVTILAQRPDKQFLLITIFGTVPENRIADFLGELGVSDAIRMDGGGSTQMVYETSLVKNVSPALSWSAVKEEPQMNEEESIGFVSVKVDKLRVRYSPDTSSASRGTAVNGEKYRVYATQEDSSYTWYQIGTNRWIAGKDGWTVFEPEGSAAAAAPAPAAEKPAAEEAIGTVTVNVDNLNIRDSASTSGRKLGKAVSGQTYSVYETSVSGGYTWYRIASSQWIAASGGWVTYSGEEEAPLQTVTVLVDNLNIRNNAGIFAGTIGKAENGKTYTVYETVETQGYLWYRIGEGQWIAGKEGWVEVK